ncbi:PREDICTED: uncharacterized protein LOC106302916 [Brassica oleracea var. oleracea]|uniref:uncharacterized protein LOC106302916 n=1 Tax=Brassica oleracea var. oleracea TaxID=109376 RepID=UPI0006A6F231|nr:PREDICTED: uncharacterized protein LOC106302916 [Brassica oleracea var. oleracea]
MAMNCLSLLLDRGAAEGQFGYHQQCRDSKLTHLCFANDLLIFCDGSLQSVTNVLRILEQFAEVSGLTVSICLTEPEINNISSTTGLVHAILPIRYLGVPLVTKKLSLANCEPLIQQVKKKIYSWSACSLSFAGRLLLINTVIARISNFWCSTFTIPKKCIKIINSLCGAYLWRGTTEGHHSARVSWDTVTLSKEEGGLGIRDLNYWNKACTLKLLWLFFFRSCSIWVAWFTKTILSDCKSNFWTIKEKQSHSFAIKKLLRVRDLAYPWIKIKIGNGRSARLWTNNWSSFGNIRELLRLPSYSALGITPTSTLHDIHRNGVWLIWAPRSDVQVEIHALLTTITLNTDEDMYEWCPNGSATLVFSTGAIY